VTSTNAPSTGTTATDATRANAPTARRDFGLLWTGQSLSLFGDQFMVLALPLLAVGVLGTSAAQAALLPFALFLPFLPLGLPAGAIVDRVPRRTTMLVCDGLQVVSFGAIWLLAAIHALSFLVLFLLVLLSGCAVVFFQVAYTSYLPELYRNADDLHRGNARLALSESTSRLVGPMVAGPVIRALGTVGAVAANALSFIASVVTLATIRHREPERQTTRRESGWLRRDIAAGLRFVMHHPMLQPIILCGTTYVLFLSVVETSLVLYCRIVLGLAPQWIGIVVGAAAGGFPIGNMISPRLARIAGTPRTLFFSASVSVAGLVAMPALGSIGGAAGAAGLVVGSVVHSIGEGAYGPASLTLRQTVSPPELLGRVGSVQRFLMWGAVSVGSLLAAGAIAVVGLSGAMWIGAVGTVLCLPVLVRRGVRTAIFSRESVQAT
jgi:MFS family permease